MHSTKRSIARRPARTGHRHTHRAERNDTASGSIQLQPLAKSLAITLLAGALSLLSCALLAYFLPNPNPWIKPLSLFAAALTALIGGGASARLQKQSPPLSGLLNGSVFMAAMILLSLFMRSRASGYSALLAILLHAGFLLFSVLGGILGKKKPKVKRKYP
ncbi:MAG: TIGR04086 family membrane protein [Ruminococcaceae bacterium]|nr:TIGR04086 family membrane protein [Oscillospiraceae bacterium]